MEKNDLLRT